MRKLAGLVGLSLCLGLGLAPRPAAAAGFDGRWIADIPALGRCNNPALLTVVVAGDAVSGQLEDYSNSTSPLLVTGALKPDGTGAAFSVDRRFGGTISFHGDRFEATWSNGFCVRHATGDRAPDSARLLAQAEERKQRQTAYADEIRRAKAGEAVDYTQMRADAVYATDWQYFDGRTKSLLVQADAAVKGKDCAQALPVLDQVTEMEFTNDSAHALKAACFKQIGDADKARIEDGIAKGLIHSLMDGWGGPHGFTQALTATAGSTEESAYVISTYYEEEDVLANRHIQVKTRQVSIRGSNGHLYDLIHGVSVVGASGVVQSGGETLIARPDQVDVRGRDIYFDITAFVTGRASRRAASDVLHAQLR